MSLPGAETDVYDRFPGLYALFRERIFRNDSREIISALWPAGVPPEGAQILEAGCGPGFYSLQLAARFSELRVTGIDLSAKLVRLAGERARSRRLDNCHFQCTDARDMDLPDGLFDAVVVSRLLMIVHRRRRTMAEVHRVLRPGGTCFIAEPCCWWQVAFPYGIMKLAAKVSAMLAAIAPRPINSSSKARLFNHRQFSALANSQPWAEVQIWREANYQYAICRKAEEAADFTPSNRD